MKKFLLILILSGGFLQAQTISTDSSFVDNLELFVKPQYGFFFSNLNLSPLADEKYLGSDINSQLKFGIGHLFGTAFGIRGYNTEFTALVRLTYNGIFAKADLKTKPLGQVIGGLSLDTYIEFAGRLEHYFWRDFGLGLEYREIYETYGSNGYPGYPSLLKLTINKKLLYLAVPLHLKNKDFDFRAKVAFSPIAFSSQTAYDSWFVYEDPDFHGVPPAQVQFKSRPHAFYLEAGWIVDYFYIPLKIMYRFDYEWAHGYYSKYKHGFNFIIGIPSF